MGTKTGHKGGEEDAAVGRWENVVGKQRGWEERERLKRRGVEIVEQNM